MGVKGLYSLASPLFQSLDLLHEAQERGSGVVLVDFYCFAFAFFQVAASGDPVADLMLDDSEPFLCMYSELAKLRALFVLYAVILRENGVELEFVYDGAYKVESEAFAAKFDTLVERQRKSRETSALLERTLDAALPPEAAVAELRGRGGPIPNACFQDVLQGLQEHGFTVFAADGEADYLLGEIARRRCGDPGAGGPALPPVIGLLSNDTDFALLKGTRWLPMGSFDRDRSVVALMREVLGLWPQLVVDPTIAITADAIRARGVDLTLSELQCGSLTPEILSAGAGIALADVPLLATLAGNDFTPNRLRPRLPGNAHRAAAAIRNDTVRGRGDADFEEALLMSAREYGFAEPAPASWEADIQGYYAAVTKAQHALAGGEEKLLSAKSACRRELKENTDINARIRHLVQTNVIGKFCALVFSELTWNRSPVEYAPCDSRKNRPEHAANHDFRQAEILGLFGCIDPSTVFAARGDELIAPRLVKPMMLPPQLILGVALATEKTADTYDWEMLYRTTAAYFIPPSAIPALPGRFVKLALVVIGNVPGRGAPADDASVPAAAGGAPPLMFGRHEFESVVVLLAVLSHRFRGPSLDAFPAELRELFGPAVAALDDGARATLDALVAPQPPDIPSRYPGMHGLKLGFRSLFLVDAVQDMLGTSLGLCRSIRGFLDGRAHRHWGAAFAFDGAVFRWIYAAGLTAGPHAAADCASVPPPDVARERANCERFSDPAARRFLARVQELRSALLENSALRPFAALYGRAGGCQAEASRQLGGGGGGKFGRRRSFQRRG